MLGGQNLEHCNGLLLGRRAGHVSIIEHTSTSEKEMKMGESSTEDVQPVAGYRKQLERFGYLGRDQFGRVYLDTCASNEEHLKNHIDGKERPGCRSYIEDLFPEELMGKFGLADVGVFFVEHKGRTR